MAPTPKKATSKRADDTAPATPDTPADYTPTAPGDYDPSPSDVGDVAELRDQLAALTELVKSVLTPHPGQIPTDTVQGADQQFAEQLAEVDRDQAQAQPATDDPEVVKLRAQLADLQKPEDPAQAEIRQLKEQIAALLAEKQQRADGTGPAKPVKYNLMLATGEVVEADNAGSSTHHYSEQAGRSVPVTGLWLVPVDDEE